MRLEKQRCYSGDQCIPTALDSNFVTWTSKLQERTRRRRRSLFSGTPTPKTAFVWSFCIILQFAILLLLVVSVVDASPHPHQGNLALFTPGDPGVSLDAEALEILASGQPYLTKLFRDNDERKGLTMVVQDVNAPTTIVWETIMNFDKYDQMVPKMLESELYDKHKLESGKNGFWVRMKMSFAPFFFDYQYYTRYVHDPRKHSLTWTLDYDQTSDLDDCVGYWYVMPHPDNTREKSRVYYSIEVSLYHWVPSFLVDFMSHQALRTSTAWVKYFSEVEAISRRAGATKKGKAAPPTSPRASNKATSEANESDDVSFQQEQERIGLKRYALVTTVLALSFYNVHLFFSS